MSNVIVTFIFFDRACWAKETLMEQVVHNTVIGMDVHQSKLVCCAMWQAGHELKAEKKTFGTFRGDKKTMALWCASFHPDLVIMESAGIYTEKIIAAFIRKRFDL